MHKKTHYNTKSYNLMLLPPIFLGIYKGKTFIMDHKVFIDLELVCIRFFISYMRKDKMFKKF